MTTSTIVRQGDVLCVRLLKKPTTRGDAQARDAQGRLVLAEGEATGHAHALSDEGMLYGAPTARERHLHLLKGGVLLHEEHAPIVLDAGWWKILRQREFTDGYVRRVAD